MFSTVELSKVITCLQLCNADTANCLKSLEGHLAKLTSDSPKYVGMLKSKMEKWLDETFQDITKGTIIRKDSMDDGFSERLSPTSPNGAPLSAFEDRTYDKEERIKVLITEATHKFKEMTDAARLKTGSTETKASYIRNQVKKQLEFEIKAAFGDSEPIESYMTQLESHMNEYIVSKVAKAIEVLDRKLAPTPPLPTQKEPVSHKSTVSPPLLEHVIVKQEVNDDCTKFNNGSPRIEFTNVTEKVFHFKGNSEKSDRLTSPLPPTPLVFQFAIQDIQMGIMDQRASKHVILHNEFGQRCTPTNVGITNAGRLVYGNEIAYTNRVDEIYTEFYLDQLFLQDLCPPASAEITIAGKVHMITAEFILGFLLKKLRATAEKFLKNKFLEAVIVIPYWLASGQRIQVKDAARVAGFGEVHLLNDVSSAAFAFVTNMKIPINQCSNNIIAVLSETANYVDCAMYSVVETFPSVRIKMAANCGRDMSEVLKHNQCGDNDNTLKDVVMSMFRQAMAKCALPNPHGKTFAPKAPTAVIVVCGEGSRRNFWRKVLESVRMEFTGAWNGLLGLNEREAVLNGAILLSQNLAELGIKVKDQLNFQLWRCQTVPLNNGTMRVTAPTALSTTMGHLPMPGKQLSVQYCFPRSQTAGTFYQPGMILGDVESDQSRLARIPVGYLKVFDTYPKRNTGIYKQYTATLKISHEGIVNLDFVLVTTRARINNKGNQEQARYFNRKRKRGNGNCENEITQVAEPGKCLAYERWSEGDGRISWTAPKLSEKLIQSYKKSLEEM